MIDSFQVTHNASPITPINYWRNCGERVCWPCYIGSDVWFQDDFWEASLLCFRRAASQLLGILKKSWVVFYDRLLLRRCYRGCVLPVLEYCSAVWCSAADTHLKLLNREISGASFLTGDVLECDFAHRQSVAVLCMLYKIGCNPLHPFFVLFLCHMWCAGAGYTLRCDRTSVHLCASSLQNLIVQQEFYSLFSISLLNDLSDPVFGSLVSRAEPISFYWPSCSLPFCLLHFCLRPRSGIHTDRVLNRSLPALTFFNNIIIIIIIIIIIYLGLITPS